VENLPQLTSLYLSENNITDVEFANDLLQLRTLDLTENPVEHLAPWLLFQKEVELLAPFDIWAGSILLSSDSIQFPPPEILRRGFVAVQEYLRERGIVPDGISTGTDVKQSETVPANEFKLVLLGDGGAGKTTLRRALLREAIPESEAPTDRIEISSWDDLTLGDGRVGRARVWDFGGQVVMHATHQCSLTHRSLYVLALDGRKEEDAEYWLDMVRSFGGDSPVLVVANKIDQNPAFQLNEPDLLTKYTVNIVGFHRVSASAGTGIDTLRNAISEATGKIELLSTDWPLTWHSVKAKLEALDEPYIDYSRYESICAEAGTSSAKTLVDFLNDLGVVVHFSRDPTLHDTHVLDPLWVTTGLYRILNAPMLAETDGILRTDALDEALAPREGDPEKLHFPRDKHAYLVGLMRKFELCYQLPGDDCNYLVPDHLPVPEPDGLAPQPGDLRFLYRFRFLPRSLFPRLLVRLNAEVADGLRWRSGAVFFDPEHQEVRATVRGDIRNRNLTIALSGGDPQARRDYLSRLRRELRSLHREFADLGEEEHVQLPGFPNHSVSYRALLGHERRNKETYFDGELDRDFSVVDLLGGIDDADLAATRQQDLQTEAKTNPVVFLSYAHEPDDPSHGEAVFNLSEQFRADGIETRLDQYDDPPQEGWPRWMQRQLREADFVLLICTPRYLERFDSDEAKAGGVPWEGAILTNTLYETNANTSTILPILFEGQKVESIPLPIRYHAHYRTPSYYENLHRVLTDQRRVKPGPIGPRKEWN